jgi:hypothetical protein
MPVPTQYSEANLAEYIVSVLDEVASLLGWDNGTPQVQEALADTLLEYGQTDLAQITGTTSIRRLRALGRRAIWRAVVQATAGKYDFRDSDATFTRSQINSQAREMLKLAETDCLEFSATYAVSIVSINRPHDPYSVRPDSERTMP